MGNMMFCSLAQVNKTIKNFYIYEIILLWMGLGFLFYFGFFCLFGVLLFVLGVVCFCFFVFLQDEANQYSISF